MALNERAVVDAARRILESYGLADLTMRRVADDLDVKAGALYYHVPNKQTLLAKVADDVLADLTEPPDGDVTAWAGNWLRTLRTVLLAHRDAAELVASALATGLVAADPVAPLASRLRAGGVPDAAPKAQAMCHFVLGHSFQEQTRSQLAALGVMAAPDPAEGRTAFEAGLGLMLDGLTDGTPAE